MKRLRTHRIAWLTLLVAGWLGLSAQPVRADGEQLYFTGMVAPLGSLSSPGQGSYGVYLRWDQMEGELPADLARFVLERDGLEIYNVPAGGAMSVVEIQGLYSGPEQARRRAEIIAALDQEAAGSDPPGTPVTAGNYAAVLQSRLLDPASAYWNYFASRSDFNVARARYRAYLDTGATPGVHQYELLAESGLGNRVRVGLLSIDTTLHDILPGAKDFVQVKGLGRCDAPESRKDHGAVALNWDQPGTSAGDRYTSALLTAGYDLYRTTQNVAAPDAGLELRSAAATVMHAADGSLPLPGLEKLNDQPIVVSSSATREQNRQGWNAPFFQFLETTEELALQGLNPGDTRAYYLVPRDLSGNYGKTERLLVIVPDTDAPPPPWGIRTVNDPAGGTMGTMKLVWDQVDVLGYYQRHRQNRTYCNLNTARFDGELRYVPEGENCDDHPQFVVDLKVNSYIVYRFDQASAAGEFIDSDGDGWSDQVERVITNPPFTDPGTACNAALPPAAPPPGTQNYKVTTIPASAAVVRDSGRKVLEYQDPVPTLAANQGWVFWYRIASVDPDGNISSLSQPVRGFFPKRARPQRCGGSGVLSERVCDYVAKRVDLGVQDPYALDATGDAVRVLTRCGTPGQGTTDFLHDIVNLPSGDRGVPLDGALCRSIESACLDREMEVSYLDPVGSTLDSVNLGPLGARCPDLPRTRLDKDCTTRTRPVEPGATVHNPLVLDCPPAPDECLNLYRDIGGKSYHYKTWCPPVPSPLVIPITDIAGLGGDQTCLSVALQNQNNEVSSKLRLPCFRLPGLAGVGPPQPVEISFTPGSKIARLTWLPPEQPAAGSIVEWFLKGGGDDSAFSDFFPHAGHGAKDGSIQVDATILDEPPGTDWQEEWCFRARTVGHAEQLSEWSGTRCGIRKPESEPLPQYIPWPEIKVEGELGTLLNRYLTADGMPVVLLTDDLALQLQGCEIGGAPPYCTSPRQQRCVERGPDASITGYCPDFCSTIRDGVGGKLGFVAYRQTAGDPLDPAGYGNYLQVSPLIESVMCRTDFKNFPTTGQSIDELQDPFLKFANFGLGDPAWDGYRVVFADQTPHIAGHWYRYQFVYFDANGEILGHRQTDWFQAK